MDLELNFGFAYYKLNELVHFALLLWAYFLFYKIIKVIIFLRGLLLGLNEITYQTTDTVSGT